MSVSIALVNTSIENFGSLYTKVNLLINAVSNVVVTTDFTANGGLTSGNAFVNGIFSANTLACNIIRGGNVQSSGSLDITASTITLGNSSVNSFANSIQINTSKLVVGNSTTGFTANTTAVVLNGVTYTTLTPQITVANNWVNIGTRPIVNFLGGTNVSLTVTDDPANTSVDVTINSSIPAHITATDISLGNSTVNTFINSLSISTNSVIANYATIANLVSVGNSTVNTTANSSQITVSKIVLGNSTVGFTANTTAILLNGKSYTNLDTAVAISNNGTLIGTRPTLNFIQGTDVTLTIADNSGQNRVDCTLAVNTAAFVVGVIGGANTQVQFNDSGGFNGVAGMTFDKTTNTFTVGNLVSTANLSTTYVTYPQGKQDMLYVNSAVTTAIVFDAFFLTDFRGGEYLLTIKDNNANNYQLSTLVLLHDGGSIFLDEYATLISNNTVGTFSCSTNTTHAILSYTANTSNNTSIKAFRKLISP